MTTTATTDAPDAAEAESSSQSPRVLTKHQQAFFATFGYLRIPGLLREEIGWISDAYDELLTAPDGSRSDRTIVPFVDSSPRLTTLLDHARLEGAIADLLGEDFNYLSSDGAYRRGDTPWHCDGSWTVGRFAKVAIYLDPITRATGALRVIPGSHHVAAGTTPWAVRAAAESREQWGIAQDQVPSVAIETLPGDVVMFDHNIMHAAFGGSVRRMFTLNVGMRATNEAGLAALRDYLDIHISPWGPRTHGDGMLATASPRRQRHLEQVIAQEGLAPKMVAKAAVSVASR
ncbi:MAG: phytanoyl-CoA dioxygenase family protein [Planctomycetes bacterium]|nr:phytanoyl-CoA dioxygenase family protein [Planctomycetota bacterium]